MSVAILGREPNHDPDRTCWFVRQARWNPWLGGRLAQLLSCAGGNGRWSSMPSCRLTG